MPFPLRAALAALLLSAAPALAHDDAPGGDVVQGDIGIHDPYAIASRPNAPTGAAFMLIHNHGSTPDRLVSAASPVAERVELHTHVEENGIARMEHVEDGFEVPAGGLLLLNRGGAHVMFLGVTDSFEDGDVVPLTLTFERAGEVTVQVPVDLDRLGGEEGGAMGHGHAGHDPAPGG